MRTIETLISQEVHACLSSLVSTLAQGYGERYSYAPHRELVEQACDLASPVPDYESAAREAGWKPKSEAGDAWEFTEYEHAIWCKQDGVGEFYGNAVSSWEELCGLEDIEPHESEVFEHWAVSPWFADKLLEAGEKVDKDFAGLCVWARRTTGQAIEADAVIQRIAADLLKSVEG